MDNENKDLQGSETEMTPEEKVQADISAKISEAAEPLKDEINEANQGEVALDDETVESGAADETAVLNEDGTPIESDEMIDVKPEPKKVTLKLSSFVTSTVAAVLVGVCGLSDACGKQGFAGRLSKSGNDRRERRQQGCCNGKR